MGRRLQNFHVNPGDDTETGSARPTTAICPNYDPEVAASRTTIRYNYNVETNVPSEDLRTSDVNVAIPNAVSGTGAKAVAAEICEESGATGRDSGLGQDSCYILVSSGTRDSLIESCAATNEASCLHYAGSMEIVHTDECSEEQVRQDTVDALDGAFGSGVFVDNINDDLGEDEGGAQVTAVTFLGESDTVGAVATSRIMDDNGLTATGKTMVSVLVLVFVLLLLICCCWRRAVLRRRRKLEDDCRSLETRWSLGLKGNDRGPNFRDLGKLGSNMNVHQCTSAFCLVCNPNLGKVNIIPVTPVRARGDTMPDEEIADTESINSISYHNRVADQNLDEEHSYEASYEATFADSAESRPEFVRVATAEKATDLNDDKAEISL